MMNWLMDVDGFSPTHLKKYAQVKLDRETCNLIFLKNHLSNWKGFPLHPFRNRPEKKRGTRHVYTWILFFGPDREFRKPQETLSKSFDQDGGLHFHLEFFFPRWVTPFTMRKEYDSWFNQKILAIFDINTWDVELKSVVNHGRFQQPPIPQLVFDRRRFLVAINRMNLAKL